MGSPNHARSAKNRIGCALLFLVLAALASWPRFGQRENEHLPTVSDSDLYLEMARVFTGETERFTPDYVAWQPHHYNRPLLPFLAGHLGKYVLDGNLRVAFSLINIIAATTVAFLLAEIVRRHRPDWRLPWLPSVLFLTGFPQLNWGYHIFTDTLGYATAFATAFYAAWLIGRAGPAPAEPSPRFWALHLSLLWAAASAAFLARETGWFAVITAGWLCLCRYRAPVNERIKLGLILAVLVLGKLPHSWYAHALGITGVPLKSSLGELLNWRYLLDFGVKSAVCFNLSWVLAVWGFQVTRRHRLPEFIIGWTIAAVLYIGAGFYVNKIHLIGYPLRMTYALFPLVFFGVTALMENRVPEARRVLTAMGVFLTHYAIGLLGVVMDPGRSGVKAAEVLRSLKDWFWR